MALGQAHIVVNWSLREYFDPRKMGRGHTAHDQRYSSGAILFALLSSAEHKTEEDLPKVAGVGRWAEYNISVIGECSDYDEVMVAFSNEDIWDFLQVDLAYNPFGDETPTLFEAVTRHFTDISGLVMEMEKDINANM